jgi:hypothetical protein
MIHISSMMMLFPISAAIIGVSAADVPLQHANAVSNDGDGTTSSCRQIIILLTPQKLLQK